MTVLHAMTGFFSGLCLEHFFNLGKMIDQACRHQEYVSNSFNRCTATIIAAAILYVADAMEWTEKLREYLARSKAAQQTPGAGTGIGCDDYSLSDLVDPPHAMPWEEGYYPGIESTYTEREVACLNQALISKGKNPIKYIPPYPP